MNPKLIKFAVELQTGEKIEEKQDENKISSKSLSELTIFLKPAQATIRNDNIN